MSDDLREKLATVLASSRRGVTAKVNDNDRRQADTVMNAFAVVELPSMVVDEGGFKTWPVDSAGRYAHVWRKRSDGTVSLDGVHTSGMTPDQVLSLAASLLAAHRYVTEEASS